MGECGVGSLLPAEAMTIAVAEDDESASAIALGTLQGEGGRESGWMGGWVGASERESVCQWRASKRMGAWARVGGWAVAWRKSVVCMCSRCVYSCVWEAAM